MAASGASGQDAAGGFRARVNRPSDAADAPRERIRVFIVSDVRLYRDGLSSLFGRIARIAVVGVAASPDEGAKEVRELQPDVVLLDTGSGNVGGARHLLETEPSARVVALGAPEAENVVIALAEAGVLGYVTREESLDDLVATIECVARDEMACSPWMATILLKRVRALAVDRPRPTQRLTARESQILELVAQGLSNKEIASRLFIEVTTVKNHVHNILEKLGVKRREEAAAHMRMSFMPSRPATGPGTKEGPRA
jgi:two-component system nitrate/nitrite response regulator NarL